MLHVSFRVRANTRAVYLVLISTVFLAAQSLAAEPAPPPNILLIAADDLGYGELIDSGRATMPIAVRIPTPHIDSIAEQGVRFTNGYVTASYCSASRAGILTGRYQTRFGHELNPVGDENQIPKAGLPLSEITLAEQLHSAGYVTGLVGKWHLGAAPKHHPLNQGFDEFFGFLHEGHYYVPPPYEGVTSFLRRRNLPNDSDTRYREDNIIWTSHRGRNEPEYNKHNPIMRGRTPIEESTYLTDAFTREAVSFINRHRSEPFFLYLCYNAVHSPMQATNEYMDRFENIKDIHRRVFAGMLANLDDGVGKVLKTLRETGLEKNTLVIFISDNGGPTSELTSSNAPLRGGKGSLYEGGIRVPFYMRWHGHVPAGLVYNKPVIATDIFATASAAAGVPLPSDRVMDGVNLTPFLTGKKEGAPHESLYWRMGNKAALRQGQWKIVGGNRAIKEAKNFELYHLAEDLSETTNLAEEKPEKLQELSRIWHKINQEMATPNWRRK